MQEKHNAAEKGSGAKKGKRNEFYETTPLRRAGFECR